MAANTKQEATLDELFKAEPDRLSRLSHEIAGLYFDWSKVM
jgi:glucose-6-phosphate isomerase